MHNFKKAIIVSVVFILIFTSISAAIISPFLASDRYYYQDNKLRDSLSGKIDCLSIGASQALAAFDPSVMDESLGCCSYNIAGPLLTLNDRYHLLKNELERNPIDTVIIEISHDTLTRDQTSEYATGDAVTIARLSSFSKRLSFMLDSVSTDDWLNVYSRLFTSAISFYGDILQNEADSDVDYKSKGILYKEANDVSLPQESVPTLCNSSMFNADYPAENIDVLDSIIQLCKSYNIRVIVVVVPVSDASIWRRCGLDDFYIWLSAFCSKMGCEMYDMNLAKDRYSLYHDDISFYDETHMSMAGAKAFTKALCDIVNKSRTGEDISPLFYKSYNEMKQDSPYMQYLTS